MNSSTEKTFPEEEFQAFRRCINSGTMTHTVLPALGTWGLIQYLGTKRGFRPKIWSTFAAMVTAGLMGRSTAIPKCIAETASLFPEGEVSKMQERRGQRPKSGATFEVDRRDQGLGLASIPDDAEPIGRQPTASPVFSDSASQKQTYADLRRAHREEFVKKRTGSGQPVESSPLPLPPSEAPASGSYYIEPLPSTSSYMDPPSPYVEPQHVEVSEEEPKVTRRKRLNKYGDEIED